jgi:sterol 3beta-glucosyltransferase
LSQSSPTSPNRKLKITILTVGSVGDVQPYCALGIGLKRAGHEVTVAANENFSSFVRQFDLEFAAIAPNMEEFLQSKKGQRLIAGEKLRLEDEEKLLRQQLHSAIAACQGTEVIIYTPPSNWGYHIAEKLEAPCFMASVFNCLGASKLRRWLEILYGYIFKRLVHKIAPDRSNHSSSCCTTN